MIFSSKFLFCTKAGFPAAVDCKEESIRPVLAETDVLIKFRRCMQLWFSFKMSVCADGSCRMTAYKWYTGFYLIGK
jgi:hypothetical protein